MKKFYRVANITTGQGLWYDFTGSFTGYIHTAFNFCQNNELKMDFDEEIVGYLSATEILEDLFKWFTVEDIKKLQKHNYCIHVYECDDHKFYNKFQHTIIKKSNIKLLYKLIIT